MLETPFPFFISKTKQKQKQKQNKKQKQKQKQKQNKNKNKNTNKKQKKKNKKERVKFRYLELFLELPIFRWKSTFSGRPCFITSLWRHTLTDFSWFWYQWKKETLPYTILPNTYTLGVSTSGSQGGGNHLQEDVLQKSSGRRRLRFRNLESTETNHMKTYVNIDYWIEDKDTTCENKQVLYCKQQFIITFLSNTIMFH